MEDTGVRRKPGAAGPEMEPPKEDPVGTHWSGRRQSRRDANLEPCLVLNELENYQRFRSVENRLFSTIFRHLAKPFRATRHPDSFQDYDGRDCLPEDAGNELIRTTRSCWKLEHRLVNDLRDRLPKKNPDFSLQKQNPD